MALTKVSTAMFDTAAQSSDLNIDANTLFVDVSTNRVGIGTTSPSVPLEVSGQLKAGGILYPTSDGSNGQALVTDGSGTASFATVAPTAGTGVTVSGTTVSIGQAVGTSSNVTFNNLVVSGTLTVNGATNTNSATNTTIEDILIELGTGTSGSPANDAGLVLERGSSDNVFIGWDESADTFTVGTGSFTGASSGNLTITPATAVFGGLTVDTSTLVVDASNNRVGIGNASPDVSLDIGSFTDAVHVPVGTTAQRPTGAAGYFRYNSTLGKFEGYTDSWGEIGGGGSNTFTTNVYTGDGSTTAFTLSQSVSSVNDLIVFIDGVYQVPTAAYTVSGTTLTMTAAPANTRKIVAYSVQSAISGTNLNQNSFTGNGSAVAFTLSIAPVNENNTQVFLDGVYQHKSTYATSGTTLTFDTAPASGVAIEVMIFTQTEINVPVDGTITTVKLAADAVTQAKIADDAVGADQLASNAVVTASIVNDAVTADKIVDNIALPGNITTTGTLVPTGVLTANAGVVVDNITIDGQEIDVSSGNLTIDVAGDMTLDAGGNNFNFAIGGTTKGMLAGSGDGFAIKSTVSDGDLIFQGNDGGSTITALTFDMQNGGKATFVSDVIAQGKFSATTTSTTAPVLTLTDSGVADYDFTFPDTGTIQLGTSTSSNKELKLLNAGSGMFGLNVEGHILPAANNTYSLGSSGARYYQVWAATNMVSPTYIATGNVTTGGYQLTDTSGNSKPAVTSDANNWTIIRPLASGSDVAINNYANTANRVVFKDEGTVGIGITNPTRRNLEISSATPGIVFHDSDVTNLTHEIVGGGNAGLEISADYQNVGTGYIRFDVGGVERARVTEAGNIQMANGGGIDFGNTSNSSGNLGSEIFNDYEDGTWSPVLISGGSTNPTGGGALAPSGRYTKVGNRVWVTFYVGRSWTNSPSGTVMIQGLPYTIHASTNGYYIPVVTYNVSNGSTYRGNFVIPVVNSNTFSFYAQSAGAWAAVDWASHVTSPIYFSGTFSYHV